MVNEIMALADKYAYATINVTDPEARRGQSRVALNVEVEKLMARNKALVEALGAMLRIHTEPAGYEGEHGKEFDHFLELQIQKCNEAIAMAQGALK